MNFTEFIRTAFVEDIRDGDHTSLSSIPATSYGKARLLVKEPGILAGVELAREIFAFVDQGIKMTEALKDGDPIQVGDIAFYVEGKTRSILMAERLVLNCMQRMSGIASNTRKYVEELEGLNTKVLDTRKTTPGLRMIEKWAVKIGGGENHRFGLYDMIMLKDNHIDFCGGIRKAIETTRKYLQENNLDLKVEIESRNIEDVKEIMAVGQVDRIMLDNYTPDQCREAVQLIAGKYETEASGGIILSTLRSYGVTGVDYISVGALTHSVKSLDLSLKAM